MQLIRSIGAQKQQSKTLLLNTVKSLSNNLLQLKNTLSTFLIGGSDVGDEHLQKLSEISSKQTIIMNRIRLGMEKQQSNGGSSLKSSTTQKPQPLKQQGHDELHKLFQEQKALEDKRSELLEAMNRNLEMALGSIQENPGSQQTNNPFPDQRDSQIETVVSSLKKDVKSKQLEKWAGTLYINIMSNFYADHIKGMRNFDDTKMEMSFAILQKYRVFVLRLYEQKFDLAMIERFQQRFQLASSKAISYLVSKCPMSKQTLDVSIFQKLSNRTDESKHPDYDLLDRLNIRFDATTSSIGPTLKILIGKIIEEVNSFYPEFKTFINEVMDGVDSKTGFSYNVERKILEGVSPYSEDEIITPGFFTKSNELMRTLVKWIEYLILPFQHPEEISKLNLFKSSEGVERISNNEREYMITLFEKRKGKLDDLIKSMNLFLQRTLSSVIVISDNPLISERMESFPFLDNSASSILLICRYIWKTIEGFANEIIRQILKLYEEITTEYQKENRREADFNLYGFFIEDLLSCECKGNKDSILLIYDNLLKEEQAGKIKILQISNNLLKPSQNVVILFKHSKSFLIFEIRLRLTGKKGDEKDEFNRFLRQLEKTILTPTFMLATNLINLNPIKEYLKKYKPYFKPNLQPFAFKDSTKQIYCKSHPETNLKQGVVYNSFVCNMCFLFIESYTHYFPKKYCPTCFLSMCSICQLKLLPQEESFSRLLSSVKKLRQYFQPLQLYKYQQPQVIKQQIINYFNQGENDYLLIINFKNSTNQKEVSVIKSLIHHNEELILTSFNNKIFNFKNVSKSIVVLLKPIHPFIQHPEPHHKPEVIYEIHSPHQQSSEVQYIYLENRAKGSVTVVDTKITQSSKIKEIISSTEIQRIIKEENRVKEGKLSFDKLIIDFSLFAKLNHPREILVLDINQCQLDPRNSLKELSMFSNLQEIFVSNTPSFIYNTLFQFNSKIVSINLTECQLDGFQFEFPKLKELRLVKNRLIKSCLFKSLPKLHTLKLAENQITSFWNLSTAQLPNLLKLDLKANSIQEQLPILKFQKLRTLELSDNLIRNIENLSMCQLPNLKQLILNNNQISVLPTFQNLPKLEVLKISKNKLINLQCTEHSNLIILDVSHNSLTQVYPFYFPSLTHFYLNNNQIADLLPLKQINWESLLTLQIQFNPIEKGKVPLFKYIDNIKVHPGCLDPKMNINPKSKCSSRQPLACTKCSKGIHIIRYYNNQHQKLCDQCFKKQPMQPHFKQLYRLDQQIMSKYC